MEWERKGRHKYGKARMVGWLLLALGIVMLSASIVLALTYGTVLTPVLLGGSVLVNTVAITLLRHGRER